MTTGLWPRLSSIILKLYIYIIHMENRDTYNPMKGGDNMKTLACEVGVIGKDGKVKWLDPQKVWNPTCKPRKQPTQSPHTIKR